MRLVLLRLLVAAGLAAVGGAAVISAPLTYDWALTMTDERAQAAVLIGAAVLLGLPLLALLLVLHLGQPLVVAGRRWPLQALGLALRLVHHRPLTSLARYAGWGAWITTALLLWPLHGAWLLLGQIGVIARVAIHLWSYGWALALVEDALGLYDSANSTGSGGKITSGMG